MVSLYCILIISKTLTYLSFCSTNLRLYLSVCFFDPMTVITEIGHPKVKALDMQDCP